MRYRKLPVIIDAIKWTGENESEVVAFAPGCEIAEANRIVIKTLEGEMRADPGDWIIRGIAGEHYPCKPDIFAMTYTAAVESTPEPAAPVIMNAISGTDCPMCEELEPEPHLHAPSMTKAELISTVMSLQRSLASFRA